MTRRHAMEAREANGIGYVAAEWPLDPLRSTLVFLHGASGTNLLWRAQIEGLAGRANVLALDLPGHGRSRGPGKETIRDYAVAVADLIRALKAPRPIPCGLSMGGAITQQLLLDHKDSFCAGILINTGSRLRVAPIILKTVEENYDAYIESFIAFAASEKTDPAILKPIVEATAGCSPEVALGDFKACDRFDVMQRLASIRVPVLVVTAEDDKLTPPKYGIHLEENIPNACRVHIENVGHLAPVEKPDRVNRAIVDFLDREKL
jgi:pimeloyl-ACP methyl ester carboxylesterase